MLATRDVATSMMYPWIRWVGGSCRETGSPSGPRGGHRVVRRRGQSAAANVAPRSRWQPTHRRLGRARCTASAWLSTAANSVSIHRRASTAGTRHSPPLPQTARGSRLGHQQGRLARVGPPRTAGSRPLGAGCSHSLLLLWRAGVPTPRIGARPARCAAGCEPPSQRPLRMNRPSPSAHLWIGRTGHLSVLWLFGSAAPASRRSPVA